MHEIKNLLEEYDKAVIAEDVVKIASHFHDNFILSTPTKLWQLNNNSEFISNLTKSFNKYKKSGALCCRMLATDIITFKSKHYIANVRWGLINNQNAPFSEFDISYCMKEINSEWKFILVIDHNEPQ
jgi:hypothetical protein